MNCARELSTAAGREWLDNGMVTGTKEVIRKLAPVGVWVALICFGLIAVDLDNNGWLSLYIGGASIALAGVMFWVRWRYSPRAGGATQAVDDKEMNV